MEICNKILHSYAMYCRKEMVKFLKCYLIPKKSYGTLSKGAIFFWPTLYLSKLFYVISFSTVAYSYLLKNYNRMNKIYATFYGNSVYLTREERIFYVDSKDIIKNIKNKIVLN